MSLMAPRFVLLLGPVRLRVWLIVLVALVFRLTAALYWHQLASADEHYFRLADSHSYWTLAEQIARSQPYQYGSVEAQVFRTPLYPLFLSALTWIPSQYWAVLAARCLGAVLGTIAVLLMMRIAENLGGPKAGFATGLISACYPSAIGMSVLVLSEMLFVPLMLGQILFWHGAVQLAGTSQGPIQAYSGNKYKLFLAFASGCLAGLATLTRPSWLLFTPCLALIQIFLGKKSVTTYFAAALAMVGLCLTMAPWWIRNALITDKLVLTTLQVGPSLMDGLRPGATGASDSDMQFMPEIIQRQRNIDQQSEGTLESTLEWRVNRLAMQTAVTWVRDNPESSIRLAFEKLKRTWSLWPDGKELASDTMRAAISLSCSTVVLLALVTTYRSWSAHRPTLAIIWLPCLYFTALHVVFVGSVRYREPGVILLIVLAGLVTEGHIHRSLKFLRQQFQSDKASQPPRLEPQRLLELSRDLPPSDPPGVG